MKSRIQYGHELKPYAVYLSQYQLLTYEQIRKYFTDELGIPLSSGSLFNFISASYAKPEERQALALIKCNLVKENKCTRMKPASILIEKGYIMYHGLSYKRMDK